MQQIKKSTVVALTLVVSPLFAFISAGARQTTTTRTPSAQTQQTPNNPPMGELNKYDPETAGRQRMEDQAAKMRNSERFKRIQSDTDKLLKLSTELKDDVEKSSKNELSLDVIRKAAEVEKLAHDVKERMKG